MKFLTHCLVILALVTAGISPACAFMSGKMMELEICAADGSVQIVRVSAEDFDPNAVASDVPEVSQFKDCAVCVHSSMAKINAEQSGAVPMRVNTYGSLHVSKNFILTATPDKAAIPRAPPVILLV